jgi:predicted DNA-binding protein (UPF0251 family)
MSEYPEHLLSDKATMTKEEADGYWNSMATYEAMVLMQLAYGNSINKASHNMGITLPEANALLKSAKQKLGTTKLADTMIKWEAIRSSRTLV